MNPGVKALLIAVLACTAGSWIVGAAFGVEPLQYLTFIGTEFNQGAIWQAATYPFFYPVAAMLSWLINSLMLWMFGNTIETEIGTRRFYRVFILASLFGAAASALSTVAGHPVAMFGLQVPLFAIIMLYCIINLEAVLQIWLIVVIPIKGKYLGAIFALYSAITQPEMIPAFAAAVAGAYLVGVKGFWRPGPAVTKKKPTPAARLRTMPSVVDKVTPIRPRFTNTSMEVEVDRILDKLRVEGMANLTPEEKETLDKHSRNMKLRDQGR